MTNAAGDRGIRSPSTLPSNASSTGYDISLITTITGGVQIA